MMKLILFIPLFALLAGCGGAASGKAAAAAAAGLAYGKPGTGPGQGCYMGDKDANHTCVQTVSNDADSKAYMKHYCQNSQGTPIPNACTADGIVATCSGAPGSMDLRTRYYGMEWADAKVDCDKKGGTLSRGYQSLLDFSDEQIEQTREVESDQI